MTNIDMIDLFYDKCEDCNVTSYADDKHRIHCFAFELQVTLVPESLF